MKGLNYFDYAAATPISPQVQRAMRLYESIKFYNPSAQYLAARDVKQDLEAARQKVARILNVRPNEIVFTAGGTESANLAVNGVMSAYPGSNCIVSAIEHDAVLKPAEKYDFKIAPVLSSGRVDLVALKKLIDNKTVLVSIMYANNEIGTVQPIGEVAKLIKAINAKRLARGIKLPLYLHTDACQATNYLRLDANRLGIHLMTLNGSKIYGPKQSGILFIKTGVQINSLIDGGGQERGLRSGTENVSYAVGFAEALSQADSLRQQESARLKVLQTYFFDQINRVIPGVVINGSLEYRLPNNLHITIPGSDNETLMMALDERGFQVAAGSACSAAKLEASHVLKALGLSEETARSSLRITMGRETTKAQLTVLIKNLQSLL